MALRCAVRQARAGLTPLAARSMGGAAPPPFARTAMPESVQEMPEEIELVWEDGVAPELTIDFDATHVASSTGLKWWLGGFAFFAALGSAVALTDPAGQKRTVTRELPFDNLKQELGPMGRPHAVHGLSSVLMEADAEGDDE